MQSAALPPIAVKVVSALCSTWGYDASSQSGQWRPRKCAVCGAEAKNDARGCPIVKIDRNGECRDCYEETKMGYS